VYKRQGQDIWDLIVVGGGLMGSAVAWHLAKQGIKILLLEKQEAEYVEGSSLGETRIARSLGTAKDIFSYLHNRAVSETKELIQFLNEKRSRTSHKIEDIYTTSPVTYIYYTHSKQAVVKLLNRQQDKFEVSISAKEAKEKFGMVVPENAIVIREFKPHSGTLNPKQLIYKLHLGIKELGSEIQYQKRVHSVENRDNIFEIQASDLKTGRNYYLQSKKIVMATGPYTGDLLSELAPYFRELIKPQRVPLIFLKMKPEFYNQLPLSQQNRLSSFYPVIDKTEDVMYSMIEKWGEYIMPIFKIGAHYRRSTIDDLDAVWKKPVTNDEIEWGMNKTIEYLNRINIPALAKDLVYVKGYSCVYSLSDNETPIVSYIMDKNNKPNPNAVVIAAMSGIGAKGAMTYGRIGADLILQRDEKDAMYAKTKSALGGDRL
jgi:glycine/D-amino acid oxidase-like deaminating enzyme